MQFLRSRGVTVGLACSFSDHHDELGECADDLLHLDLHAGFGFRRDLASLLDLRYLLRRWEPHVLHTHSLKLRLLGHVLARRAGVPLLLHSDYGEDPPLPLHLARLSHHVIANRGTGSASRTVIEDLDQESALPKLYTLYQNLWARHGGLLYRKRPEAVRN